MKQNHYRIGQTWKSIYGETGTIIDIIDHPYCGGRVVWEDQDGFREEIWMTSWHRKFYCATLVTDGASTGTQSGD